MQRRTWPWPGRSTPAAASDPSDTAREKTGRGPDAVLPGHEFDGAPDADTDPGRGILAVRDPQSVHHSPALRGPETAPDDDAQYERPAGQPASTADAPGLQRERPIWESVPTADDAGPQRGRPLWQPASAADDVGDPGSASGPPTDPELPRMPADSDSGIPLAEEVRRLRFGEVADGHWLRPWRRTAVIAIVAGLVVTLAFGWRFGVTAAVLVAVADALYRPRRAATAAARDASTKPRPLMRHRSEPIGARRRTRRQVHRLERAGYRALHDCVIPESPELIDHLVIGPTGVYAIDSESWNKRLPIRTKQAKQLWHGPFSKKDRLDQARWEADQASRRLTAALRTDIKVRPAMAVYGPPIPWTVLTIKGVDVFQGRRLKTYLRKDAAKTTATRLSRHDIEVVHAAAARALPPEGASAPAVVD